VQAPTNTTNTAAVITDQETMQHFQQYIKDFDRVYDSLDQMAAKYQTFKENYKNLKARQSSNTATHQMGITKYMDMKPTTFQAQFKNAKISAEQVKTAQKGSTPATPATTTKNTLTSAPMAGSAQTTTTNPPVLKSVPTSWDWRNSGVVGVVKDQGPCGSCWAHSASGNIESMYAIKYGTLYNLSVSQLLDCSYANEGCIGGNQANAFDYLESAGGLESEANYPYVAQQLTCRANSNLAIARVSSYFFTGSDEDTMKNYVYTNGPIAVVFNAYELQFYTSGIITTGADYCEPTAIDHAVLIVGFGSSNGLNYWIVKNSYGPNWGENGYFRIARGYGTCGINQYSLSAIVA